MSLIFIALIATTLGATIFGFLYRYFVRPAVSQHFGEEHRRDFEARKRRRAFEAKIGSAMTCVYFSSVARVVGESLPQMSPWIFWGTAGLLLLLGIAFVHGAFQQWREPFAD